MRASTDAPAHIVHGSSVTASVQPDSRHVPNESGSRPQREHLRVRRRVAGQLARIAPDAEHLAVRIDDDSTDRDVGRRCGEHGLL